MLSSLARRSASASVAGWSRTGAISGRQCAAAAAASLCRAAAAASAAAPSAPAASSSASSLSLRSTFGRGHARVFHSSARRLLQLGGGPPSGGEQGAQGTWVNPNNVPAGEALKKYWSVNRVAIHWQCSRAPISTALALMNRCLLLFFLVFSRLAALTPSLQPRSDRHGSRRQTGPRHWS